MQLILDAAIDLLTQSSRADLSVRAVAAAAGISERTIFRYFATRDDLADAVAKEIYRRMEVPQIPERIDLLNDYTEKLYDRFEKNPTLAPPNNNSEILERLRGLSYAQRAPQIGKLVDQAAPTAPAELRRLTAINLYYHLIASTWHYYRHHLGLSAGEAVAASQLAITQAIAGLNAA